MKIRATFSSECEWDLNDLDDEQKELIDSGECDIDEIIGPKFWEDACAWLICDDWEVVDED